MPSLEEVVNALGEKIDAEVDPLAREIHIEVQWAAGAALEEIESLNRQLEALRTHLGVPINIADIALNTKPGMRKER